MRTTLSAPGRPACGRPLPTLVLLTFALLVLPACERDEPLSPPREEPQAPGRVLGLVEITLTGIGTAQPAASALSAPSMAVLEELRAAQGLRAGTGSPLTLQSLTPPTTTGGGGDGTIQLQLLSTGSFTEGVRGSGGVRYLWATYRVRNAQSDGTPYDTPRQNLMFLAVGTGGANPTLAETAVSRLQRFDGSAADSALAATLLPSGALRRSPTTGAIELAASDVLQVLTESEAAAIDLSGHPAITTVFPYGFVVRNPATPGSRTLPDSPAPGQFDGLVTFAFKLPLQGDPADDPYTISLMFLAIDDTETRVTESLEEQGTTSVQAAADALGASVTLLGNSTTAVAGHGMRRICRVRTAGTDPNAPLATLVDAASCATGAVALPPNVIVVDSAVAAGGNGRSWATAFRYLQDALSCVRDDAGPGGPCEGVSEIWVANGTYYPDEGAGQTDNDPGSRFELVEGVSLYGGFAGHEYSRDQRDWAANPTILDGDLDRNGVAALNDAARIVFADATSGAQFTRTTVLDGFTLRRAFAGSVGGAFYCEARAGGNCSPTLRNLVFTESFADGAGVHLRVFDAGSTAAPLIQDVAFTANTGAGASLKVTTSAGATARPEIVRAVFSDNVAGIGGGAVTVAGTGATAHFYNTVFRNNEGPAGAVESAGDSIRFVNVEFWNNEATDAAGAGAVNVSAPAGVVAMVNVTMAGNVTAGASGGALRGGSLDLSNVIVRGNSPAADQVASVGAGSTIRSSLLQNGCPAGATCVDVSTADPLFVNLAAGDLRLADFSPAIDAGDGNVLPADIFDLDGDGNTAEPIALDVAGRPRIFDWGADGTPTGVDIGAHERQ